MDDRIMTLHPEGKAGVNISRDKYDTMRATIVRILREREGLTFTGLTAEVRRALEGRFEGSINWYVTTVKLDLEARGVIERVPQSRPQRLRLAGQQQTAPPGGVR